LRLFSALPLPANGPFMTLMAASSMVLVWAVPTYQKIDGRARLLVGEAWSAAIYGMAGAGGTRSQKVGSVS